MHLNPNQFHSHTFKSTGLHAQAREAWQPGMAPALMLLQGDACAPGMARPEAWGGLARCHAAVALEVLQRLDVQQLG